MSKKLKLRFVAIYLILAVFAVSAIGVGVALYTGKESLPPPRPTIVRSIPQSEARRISDAFTQWMATDFYYNACSLTQNPSGCQQLLDGSFHDIHILNVQYVGSILTKNGWVFTYIGRYQKKNIEWSVTIGSINGQLEVIGLQ